MRSFVSFSSSVLLLAGAAAAQRNGDFERASTPAAPVLCWHAAGGPGVSAPGLSSGAQSALLSGGPGINLLSGSFHGAAISQRFWSDFAGTSGNSYVRFAYSYDDPSAGGASALVWLRGPSGVRAASLPDNDGVASTVQVEYPSCGPIDLVFAVVEPGLPGSFAASLRIDAVTNQCASTPFGGATLLPWDPAPPAPGSPGTLLCEAAANSGALAGSGLLHLYDGSTAFTSRPGNQLTCRAIQRFPADFLNGSNGIVGARVVVQDQNASTVESFFVEILRDDGTGRPDVTAPLYTAGPYAAPVGGTGAAFTVHTLLFPDVVPAPCGEDRYLSIVLPPAPSWTSDGLSVHNSLSGVTPISVAIRELPKGEPRTDLNLAWQEVSGVVTEPSGERCWDMALILGSPALRPWASIPAFTSASFGATSARTRDFGQAGLYPDLIDTLGEGRFDGFGFRGESGADVGTGTIGLLLLSSFPSPAFCLPITPTARFGLDPSAIPVIAVPESGGIYEFDFGALAASSPGLTGLLEFYGVSFYTQMAVLDPAEPGAPLRMSNSARQSY
jgi:hypothetical protein